MNYTSPLILSVFIHLGIGLSFSNFFNIDFDIFNIESAKPISAYVIFEKETEPKKEKTRIPKKNKGAEPCLLYTSPSPRDATLSRMPSSA